MAQKDVLKAWLFLVLIIGSAPAIAQTYNLGIRQQLALWEQYYGLKGRDTFARSDRGEVVDPNCPDRKRGPKFTRVSAWGVDQRFDENGELSEEVKLTEAEKTKYNGVMMIACGAQGTAGTANLIRDANGELKFITAAHTVIPRSIQEGLDSSDLNEENLRLLRKQASECFVAIIDPEKGITGSEVKMRLNASRIAIGTMRPNNDPGNDWFAFKLEDQFEELIKDLNPIELKTNRGISVNGIDTSLVAYHYDLTPVGIKIKTTGKIRHLGNGSDFKRHPGLVASDVDTSGWASGGLYIDPRDGKAFAIHTGGPESSGQEADYINNTNLAALITRNTIQRLNEF